MQKVLLDELDRCSHVAYLYDVHDQLRQHVYARSQDAFDAGDAIRERLASPQELQEHQRKLRSAFLDGSGGLPSSASPLQPVITGREECDAFAIEKIVFQSRPKHYVTGNLYLPLGVSTPTAAVLCLCGHSQRAKQDEQRTPQILARSGLIALAIDPLGQGERLEYYQPDLPRDSQISGAFEHDYAGAQCLPLGDGLARYFLHDAMRAIDYLQSRPEVDARHIGVTGASGGGTQTMMLMMTEPRIAAVAPACFVTSRPAYQQTGQAQDAEQIWFNFSAAGFDHTDALLAMAPRPVLVLSVSSDFFPIEGTRDSVEKARCTLKRAGIEGEIELYEERSVHNYTDGMARAAAIFFNRHLAQRECPNIPEFEALPAERLTCTASGQVATEYSDAEFVYDANRERVQKLRTQRQNQDRESALNWLHERVFSHRAECLLNPRYFQSVVFEELQLDFAHWWSQPQLLNHGVLIRHPDDVKSNLQVTMAIWDGGTSQLSQHLDWIRSKLTSSGNAVFVVDLSGCGAIVPRSLNPHHPDDFYGTIHKLASDLRWIGDDLAALRTYEVIRAAEMLRQWHDNTVEQIHLYGEGLHGLYVRLAAPLGCAFSTVFVEGGVNSYEDFVLCRHYSTRGIHSILLSGALKYFDLPDLADNLNSQ